MCYNNETIGIQLRVRATKNSLSLVVYIPLSLVQESGRYRSGDLWI